MNIGIVDADFISSKYNRFPNLACMKISAYHKEKGDHVQLLTDWDSVICGDFDRLKISKVFSNTDVPQWVLNMPNAEFGGTGFHFDKAQPLPNEIEHHKPDYHLYDSAVNGSAKYKYYNDYSIGFLTRGCFRKCGFCVNRNYSRSVKHSPISEFYDPDRKKLCFLDDNFLACSDWERILDEVEETGKRFQFNQGLDERLLTPRKCERLFKAKYDGSYTFAFDDYRDRDLIVRKLELIRQFTDKECTFYVLCGFDRNGRYDQEFWDRDIIETFDRINILRRYRCLPYIMRHEMYNRSPYRGLYITLARWCNQPSMFKKKSLSEYLVTNGAGNAPKMYVEEWRSSPLFRESDLYEKADYRKSFINL